MIKIVRELAFLYVGIDTLSLYFENPANTRLETHLIRVSCPNNLAASVDLLVCTTRRRRVKRPDDRLTNVLVR